LWIAIVVSMIGFAIGDLLGWVNLNPKPMLWWNYIIGGAVFGVGTVLAGGCVSGCLYKGATGNINSIVALLAMPVGIGLVEYGPLNGWYKRLTNVKTNMADGTALSLHSATGIPFWVWALVFASATLIAVMVRKGKATAKTKPPSDEPVLKHLITRPWKPWQAGLAIGLIALFAYMSSASTGRNYPLGVTHGVLQAEVLLTDAPVGHVYQRPPATPPTATPSPAPQKKVVWWLVLLVASFAVGAFTSGILSGQAKLLSKPPEQTLVAILGGFLVGAGAALATGCVIGNIMSGWALMSLGMLLFGVVTILANWATTYLYLIGIDARQRT
jgi:hypothetical protein